MRFGMKVLCCEGDLEPSNFRLTDPGLTPSVYAHLIISSPQILSLLCLENELEEDDGCRG